MSGLVNVPTDSSLWPLSWTEVQYKKYERFPYIVLPKPIPKTFGHEDLVKRKSVRDFGSFNSTTNTKEYKQVSLQQISNILYYSCGEIKNADISPHRIQPSGGGRYPLEIYILNFEKGDLDVRCYHYNVHNHTLEDLWEIPLTSRKDISLYFGYEWSTDATLAIVLSGVTQRTVMKYGERGYKYMYLEAGAILNNIQNNSMLEDIGSVIMGATNEIAIEDLLDLDGESETVIMGILLG